MQQLNVQTVGKLSPPPSPFSVYVRLRYCAPRTTHQAREGSIGGGRPAIGCQAVRKPGPEAKSATNFATSYPSPREKSLEKKVRSSGSDKGGNLTLGIRIRFWVNFRIFYGGANYTGGGKSSCAINC